MAAEVKPTPALKLPAGPSPLSSEQRYWRSFKSQLQVPSLHSTPITHISYPGTAIQNARFSNPSPEMFAVTSGGRVQIFSTRTRKPIKTISRLSPDDTAHSGTIRRDGRILASAGDSGIIQVFDVNSRAILKTYKHHKLPIHRLDWSPTTLPQLLSFSDDRSIRLWDLSENDTITTFHGHQDYIRTGCFIPDAPSGNLFISGSYDQTTRLWDTRVPQRAAMIFAHSAPVEAVLPMPGATTLLSSSGPSISVLDLVAAKPLTTLRSHQKTITSLSLASGSSRVLSSGLDGHVKVYDTASWSTVAGLKFPAPILSLCVIPTTSTTPATQAHPQTTKDDTHLLTGLSTGILSIRTRLSPAAKSLSRARDAEMAALAAGTIDSYDRAQARRNRTSATSSAAKKPSGIRKRLRGLDTVPLPADEAHIVIDPASTSTGKARPKKLPPHDRALRRGLYAEALDLALSRASADPTAPLTVLRALIHRSALAAALKGRDEETILPVLRWVVKHLSDARTVELVARVAVVLVELYGGEMGEARLGAGGGKVASLMERLHDKVRGQVEGSQAAWATKGMLEVVMLGAGGGG